MGASKIRRIGGCMVVAAALAGATASSASAMAMPACATALAPGAASSSCGFGNISTSYATITVAPVGSVTATVRCFTSWGTTYTSSRTVSSTSSWRTYAPGIGPIIDPGPTP